MCIGFTDEIDALVKDECRPAWSTLKSKFFVLDKTDPKDLRMPGKWKEEFSTTNGGICM